MTVNRYGEILVVLADQAIMDFHDRLRMNPLPEKHDANTRLSQRCDKKFSGYPFSEAKISLPKARQSERLRRS
jgi:hypothetical protein